MTTNPDKLLSIYLNDHLAGATVGVELARRLRASNAEDPRFGAPLAMICSEVEADRASLEETMDRLDIPQGKIKPATGWAGEKLGRLKLNGQLHGYSPLSRLVELEMLLIGITGKQRMWETLQQTRREVELDFELLAGRAEHQRGQVEGLHHMAAEVAFAPATGARGGASSAAA